MFEHLQSFRLMTTGTMGVTGEEDSGSSTQESDETTREVRDAEEQTNKDDNSLRLRKATADIKIKKAHELASSLPYYWGSILECDQVELVLVKNGECLLTDGDVRMNSRGFPVSRFWLHLKNDDVIKQMTVEYAANDLVVSCKRTQLAKYISSRKLTTVPTKSIWEASDILPPYPRSPSSLDHLFEMGRMAPARLRLPSQHSLDVVTVTSDDVTQTEREINLNDMIRLDTRGGRHVLGLWGACVTNDRLTLIVENVVLGPLSDYLNREKLNSYSRQICAGLLHLEHSSIVHKKLSLDVCLMVKKDTVKIALFCLSTGLYPKQIYTDDAERCRWLPWECLGADGKPYSTKGMVWTFGTILWSIYHQGALPFENESASRIRCPHYRQTVVQPTSEELLPASVAEIIDQCWAIEELRPNFISVYSMLSKLGS